MWDQALLFLTIATVPNNTEKKNQQQSKYDIQKTKLLY